MIDNVEKFKGIFPAFYAFYDDLGGISRERTMRAAEWMASKGINGLYLTGSSGEGMLLSVEERKKVYDSVLDAVGGKITIIAHVAANTTADSIELASYAGKCGVDAISAVPNIYYPLPENCIERNWDAMIEAARLPFFIYNVPSATGTNVSMHLFEKMIQKEYVIGIKTTSPDASLVTAFLNASEGKAVIFYGEDAQLLAGLSMGAVGGIGGTYGAMPELYVQLYKAFCKGDIPEAQKWQRRAVKAFKGGRVTWSTGVANMKAILEARGVETGGCRKPFITVPKTETVIVEAAKMVEDWAKEI